MRKIHLVLGLAVAIAHTAGAHAEEAALLSRRVAPSPLLQVEQHRMSIVDRLVSSWLDRMSEREGAGAAAEWQLGLREDLMALRSDQLLAASLAGSYATIEAVIAQSRRESETTGRVGTKTLGDTNRDLVYTPITPCRIVDTRNAGGRLQASVVRTFIGFNPSSFVSQGGVAADCGIPHGVAALAMTVVAVSPANLGFITLWPEGAARPFASTINYDSATVNIATGSIVPVGALVNRFHAFSPVAVDLVIDVAGYFKSPGNFFSNTVTGAFVGIGGGYNNTSSGDYSSIAGGHSNTASGYQSAIGGGYANLASGESAVVSGGTNNSAQGRVSAVVTGYANQADGVSSFVGGGVGNLALADHAFIGGGRSNQAGSLSIVAGGENNQATGNASAIVAGRSNVAVAESSFIGGGTANTASGAYGVVSGGFGNRATGPSAVVGGGSGNSAAGYNSVVTGGGGNVATGAFSFAAGGGAVTQSADTPPVIHDGVFIWADTPDVVYQFPFHSVASNEFAVRARGGVRFVTAIDPAGVPLSGVQLAAGGGAWASLSDQASKDDFDVVDPRAVLADLMTLPVRSWRYRAETSGARHMGPTAQAFRATFGLGDSDRTITTVDADGVALAAIQGLHQELRARDLTIASQADLLRTLAARVEALEERSKQ